MSEIIPQLFPPFVWVAPFSTAWPWLVLGLVLGSIMVERLTAGASQITSAADLVNRPVAGLLASVILVIVLATTATGIFRRCRRL